MTTSYEDLDSSYGIIQNYTFFKNKYFERLEYSNRLMHNKKPRKNCFLFFKQIVNIHGNKNGIKCYMEVSFINISSGV